MSAGIKLRKVDVEPHSIQPVAAYFMYVVLFLYIFGKRRIKRLCLGASVYPMARFPRYLAAGSRVTWCRCTDELSRCRAFRRSAGGARAVCTHLWSVCTLIGRHWPSDDVSRHRSRLALRAAPWGSLGGLSHSQSRPVGRVVGCVCGVVL